MRKGDLFVMNWARVRRVRQGSISSELLMCGGSARIILLLPLVARCIDIYLYCNFLPREDKLNPLMFNII